MSIQEYKRYKDDPFWMKSKYDGVSGEQNLPVQRRLRKGEVKFKKGDEILYYPNGKVILVGKTQNKHTEIFRQLHPMKIFICLNTRNQQ